SDHSPQEVLAQFCWRGSSEDHAPVAPKRVKRKRAQMSNLGLDRGRVCRVLPHSYALGTLAASPDALPATIRYTRSPSVFSDSSESPSFLRTTAARKARTVCGCQPVERVTVAMVAPFGPHSSASTRACFEFARPLDSPLPAGFERILDADRALMVRAGLRLDMQNSSQERRRNNAPEGWRNSAPPPPKPRGGPSALAGCEEQAGQARRP